MIRFADNNTKKCVWDMWKTVFGDPDNYMELYFRTKYKNENTLIYIENEIPVASLQMLEFNFTFYGAEIPIYYLSGVCTLPEARKKGYMDRLLIRSFEVAKEREIPLMLLVPQEEWLLGFYSKYGFAQTFDQGIDNLVSLKELKDKYQDDMESAYVEFDSHFRNQDMTVQKTLDDFMAIMEEAALWNYPPKKSLVGMSRIIDAKRLVSIYAEHNAKNLAFKVNDNIISDNNIATTLLPDDINVELDISSFAQLLLGYNPPEMNPQIHFMLE